MYIYIYTYIHSQSPIIFGIASGLWDVGCCKIRGITRTCRRPRSKAFPRAKFSVYNWIEVEFPNVFTNIKHRCFLDAIFSTPVDIYSQPFFVYSLSVEFFRGHGLLYCPSSPCCSFGRCGVTTTTVECSVKLTSCDMAIRSTSCSWFCSILKQMGNSLEFDA